MEQLLRRLYPHSAETFYQELEERLMKHEKTFIVTANAETMMKTPKGSPLYQAMLAPNCLITADGESVLYAARTLGYPITQKIAGIDIVKALLTLAHQHHLKVFLYGAKQEVLDTLGKQLTLTYPQLILCGIKNGYEEDPLEDILQQQPDIIIVALGVPAQEQYIARHLSQFSQGIWIGCGGSLDVLSGLKKRAPAWMIQHKLEWCYRLLKEPQRFQRFYQNNLGFMQQLHQLKKAAHHAAD